MGSQLNSKPTKLYGALLRLYPPSFQKQYSTTMEQTFTDLLEGEQTKLGRLMVWTRTLFDLPFSATKEHLTGGKEIHMKRNTKLILACAAAAVLLVGIGAWWEGNMHARSNFGVVSATAADLADAMQQDHFYNTYGDTAVLFKAKVADVKTQGKAALVTFETGRPYNVVCQFPQDSSFTKGQIVSVAAPAGSAERQPSGVLLHECVQN